MRDVSGVVAVKLLVSPDKDEAETSDEVGRSEDGVAEIGTGTIVIALGSFGTIAAVIFSAL